MTPSIPTANPDADPKDKAAFYSLLEETVRAVIDPSLPLAANLANLSSVIYFALVDPPHNRKINWAGFYLTEIKDGKPPRLVLGPFQGRVACTIIPFGKGVCGTAAGEKRTVVVQDVHDFPGHIACDSASESEIVVPIVVNGQVVGVLDIDCLEKGGFNDDDKAGMESVKTQGKGGNPSSPAASLPEASAPVETGLEKETPHSMPGGIIPALSVFVFIPILWAAAMLMAFQVHQRGLISLYVIPYLRNELGILPSQIPLLCVFVAGLHAHVFTPYLSTVLKAASSSGYDNRRLHTAPTQADVVVCGGGLLGVSTAYHIAKNAKRPLKVVVIEKDEMLMLTSSKSTG
ncbi:hypothetical protein HDU97_005945 [Phlyctochytrium planicorne]|nr:hypothetical protein HDU97_005945 [Phlyctochytrium planicorne]